MISRWTFEGESGLGRKFGLWQGAISTGLGLISPKHYYIPHGAKGAGKEALKQPFGTGL